MASSQQSRPNYQHNLEVLQRLKLGDRVRFDRGFYSHWGIHIGRGKIVHLAGRGNDGINANVHIGYSFSIAGVQFSKAEICIEDFWSVVDDSKAYIDNSLDSKLEAYDPFTVVSNATQRLGEVGYNLIYSNCEHFVNWCRYGKCKSDQVENAVTGMVIAVAAGVTAGLIYGLVKYFGTEEKEVKSKKSEKTLQYY
ncbi:phospholipase A and acyltransferase 2-like [Biomphalaria glabrata]|uniref:Phospholipase A and acyltransferase 2-like n=1 Tax=Biomphalaria glabrata TaxID=6526 RepID=A0A9U8DW43_BIOGL|nr:phospholipase A and acyltransferase 2-like [Biomphalaria glabrata]